VHGLLSFPVPEVRITRACVGPSCKIAATKIAGMNESVLRTARGGTAVRPKTVQGWTSDSERMVFSSEYCMVPAQATGAALARGCYSRAMPTTRCDFPYLPIQDGYSGSFVYSLLRASAPGRTLSASRRAA
jgi:hypothetical protein